MWWYKFRLVVEVWTIVLNRVIQATFDMVALMISFLFRKKILAKRSRLNHNWNLTKNL